jgi:hypothetical protein
VLETLGGHGTDVVRLKKAMLRATMVLEVFERRGSVVVGGQETRTNEMGERDCRVTWAGM